MITVVEVKTDGATTLELQAAAAQVVEVVTLGPKGNGVPDGGTAAQVMRKVDSANLNVEWHTLVKADVGLGAVDNTSDADKNAAAVALSNKTIDGGTF